MVKMEDKTKKQLAAIRIRGMMHIKSRIEDTLKMLHLSNSNNCTVLPNNPIYEGMLRKAKDYITWGEIDDETFKMLVDKRGQEVNSNTGKSSDFMTVNNKKIKKYFRLSPPRKGFERKGIKHTYTNGGVLGYRGDAINELIKKMV